LARSAFLEIGFLEQAFSAQEVMQNDPGRAYIMPLLQKQYLAANNADSFLGYGVINGNPVPSKFIDVYPVEKGDTVILASDGYPELKSSLDESEERLQQILKEDPLFQKEFKSTKGLKDNQLSFDDRAYLSIKI
jgi:glycerophosphoryl diester phosphodiesterase